MNCTVVVLGLLGCVGIAEAAPTAFHDAVAADNPMLWYRFDESSGTGTVANSGSLGSAHDGALFNGPALGASTLSGDTGVLFDRTTSPYIDSGASVPPELLGNPDFTCEAIINLDEISVAQAFAPFLYWGQSATGQSVFFSISGFDDQRTYVGFFNGGLRLTCPYTSDGWLHLVWTRDSASGSNDTLTGTRLWVNGVEAPLEPDPAVCCSDSAVVDIRTSSFQVQRAGAASRYWSGTMDELVLYDRVLSDAEVQEHYAATGINQPYQDCAADINLTCSVDPADFTAWLGCFNDPGSQPYCDRADVNQSGSIEPSDFTAWLAAFNSGCG